MFQIVRVKPVSVAYVILILSLCLFVYYMLRSYERINLESHYCSIKLSYITSESVLFLEDVGFVTTTVRVMRGSATEFR